MKGHGWTAVVERTNTQSVTGIFYGWRVVSASAVGLFWGPPVVVFSFPVFLKPLMQSLHAGRAAVSLGFTVHLITVALSAPLVGWLIDRYGAHKVIVVGTMAYAFTLLLNVFVGSLLWRFYVFNVVLGLAANSVGPVPYGKIVSVWFDRLRGLAFGLMMIGIGTGAMIIPLLDCYSTGSLPRRWRRRYSAPPLSVLVFC
jgi:MFS family permease